MTKCRYNDITNEETNNTNIVLRTASQQFKKTAEVWAPASTMAFGWIIQHQTEVWKRVRNVHNISFYCLFDEPIGHIITAIGNNYKQVELTIRKYTHVDSLYGGT